MTRILVVDDVKLFRHMEATVLGWRGYTIEEASNGEQALEIIRADPPDLVLLDFYMPRMTGSEVCSQIKSDPTLEDIPVIMITSSNRDEDIREAVQAGCDDFLSKPLDEELLVRKVEDLLGSSSKRRFPRVSASMQVSFEDFKGIFFEYARDISRTGVFIEMEEPIPVGSRMRLSFSLPEPFDHQVQAYGKVVRSSERKGSQPPGVGVSFIHVDEDSLRTIDALVAGQDRPADETKDSFSRLSLQLEGEEPQQIDMPEARLKLMESEQDEMHNIMTEMRKDHLRLSAMLAISEGLMIPQTPQKVVQAAVEVLSNLLGAAEFGIFLLDPESEQLHLLSARDSSGKTPEIQPASEMAHRIVGNKSAFVFSPAEALFPGGPDILGAGPISSDQHSLGLITINSLFTQKESLTLSDQQLLEMLGLHLGRSLVRAISCAQVGELDSSSILKALS